MPERNQETLLNSLVEYLQDRFDWEFNKDAFDDRFLLQKYVFFAQRLGYPTEYLYNIYIFGAYSPNLAQDYYNKGLSLSERNLDVSELFDTNGFQSLVRGRNAQWLEVASTALLYSDRYDEMERSGRFDKIVTKTSDEKDVSEGYVEEILHELRENGLLE